MGTLAPPTRAPLPASYFGSTEVLDRGGRDRPRMGPGIPIEEIAALREVDVYAADEVGPIASPFQWGHRGHAAEVRLSRPAFVPDAELNTERALVKLRRILDHATYEAEESTPRALEVLARLATILEAHLSLSRETRRAGALDWR